MLSSQAADAQRIDALGPQVRNYVSVGTPKVILEHVQVIDGTGVAAVADHNISIQEGKITTISPGTDLSPTEGTTILNLRGYSVMPGIVGTHNHLFYLALPNFGTDGSFDSSPLFHQMSFSAPRLYLANGVTTMRATGSAEDHARQRDFSRLHADLLRWLLVDNSRDHHRVSVSYFAKIWRAGARHHSLGDDQRCGNAGLAGSCGRG